MPQPSQLLQALLTELTNAKKDATTLVLSQQTLGQTPAAGLLQLFSDELQIDSFELDNVQLPASVASDRLAISGGNGGVMLTVTFQDANGAVAVQAIFQASKIATLQAALPKLAPDFFARISVSDTTASVTLPWLAKPLSVTGPVYGVTGLAIPSSGLIATSVAPRVDGEVTLPSGAKGLYLEVETATTGYHIGPNSGAWTFDDAGWLAGGLQVLSVFPAIIPSTGVGLGSFELAVSTNIPALSSVSLEVSNTASPGQPLWSAVDGKVQLTDVILSLGLEISQTNTLSLSGSGYVLGDFKLGSLVLQAEIPFPLTGVWSITAYPNLSLNVLDDIATLLDGGSKQLASLMPPKLAALGAFEFSYLRIAVDAGHFKLVEFTFALSSTETWTIVPDAIDIDSVRFSMTIDGTPSITGSVTGTIVLPHQSRIFVTFGRNNAKLPWRLDVISPAVALPSLGELTRLAQGTTLDSMVQAGGLNALHFVMTDLNFGLTISPTALTNLGLTLQLANASDPLRPALDWELIPNVLTLTKFAFGFQLNWGAKPTKDVFGSFVVNGLEFDVRFAQQSDGAGTTDALIAEYSAEGSSGNIDIKQLINAISPSVASGLPDGLVIGIDDALLAYWNNGTKKKYLFAMDISLEVPLSNLPLVGNALPADQKVGIKDLKIVVTSDSLTPDEVNLINKISPRPVLPLPQADAQGDAIPSGFSMLAELELGPLSILMTSSPGKKAQATQVVVLTPSPGGVADAPQSDSVMWIDVQKTFGPVSIGKIGFSYRSGSVYVLSNMSLMTGPLEIDLIGIGIGSKISSPSLEFTIEGLAVSYQSGPVSIMGGMIGSISPLDFVGALSVRTSELALAAFAGYRELDHQPSMFLYGVLDAPIGGPPPFFVTGVAAGFGFNRKLVIPDVSGVADFPLVAWAMGNGTPQMDPTQPIGGQVAKVLAQLSQSGIVAPSIGDYWFAAGVHFRSFEIVDSFALATVVVGTDVEVAVLGLSTMTIPPEDPSPVAEVQLALEVSFSYDKGLLAVAGQLTPNSYVLSHDCRLTGGFAFYLWFAGDHAGETVVTIGGYNPNFSVPNYWPQVPRLGLNWQVVPSLNITGSLYFAMSSNVVMAGGKLSAVWNGGPVSAWFTYWADFLMQFKPFHYYIDGGIDLGASFTVDLWLFSISVTIHIGVDLVVYGPPFAGKATVDLSIISFTIEFNKHDGDTSTALKSWNEFVTQLLPATQQASPPKMLRRGRMRAMAKDDPTPEPAVVHINVISGLIRQLEPTADGPVFLVTAETFQCSVTTVIPSKSMAFLADPSHPGYDNLDWAPDAQQPHDGQGKLITPNQDFGAGPANISASDFQPALTLSVDSEENSMFHAVRRFANAPKAFWENKSFTDQGVPKADPGTALTQSTIPNALMGATLTPYLDPVDVLLPIPLESLLFTLDSIQPFAWSPGVPPVSDSFSGETVAGTIADPKVSAVRKAILDALAAQGVTVDTALDIDRLKVPANDDFSAAPRLRLLGEQAATPQMKRSA